MTSRPRTHIPLRLPDVTWAYIAGVIDGEGCLGVYPVPRNYQVRVTVSQVTPELPQWLHNTLGGTVRRNEIIAKGKEHTRYTWGVYSELLARDIIRNCFPWLIVKK